MVSPVSLIVTAFAPVEDVRRFETEFLQYLRHASGSPLQAIRESKVLSGDSEDALKAALAEFADTFTTSEGTILGREPAVKPMDAAAVGQEKVQVQRPAPKK